MTTTKKAPKAKLHNRGYKASSARAPGVITLLCKIAALPDFPNATANALRTCFSCALATKKFREKTSRKY